MSDVIEILTPATPETLEVVVAGPQGVQGDTGPANTLAIGTVTTGAAGSSADATITGDAPNQTLNLTIPTGATGATGPQGPTIDDASLLTTGTLADARLSSNVAFKTQSSDMEITDNTKGLILKSPNNTRWRLTINDDGTLSRAALALMTLLAFAASGMAQVRDMVTDTNGNIVTGRTGTLTWANALAFGTNAATTRTNLGLGTAATNEASAFQPASANLTNLASNNAASLTNFPALLLRTNGSAAGLTNFPTLNQNTTGTASNVTGVVAIANGGTGATNASNARTALGLGETNNVTFSNVTANGTLTVGSIATTAPVSWALDAVQTAANTNGVLDLPLTANVLRITNANTISTITNGRLGAFYFLLNQSGTNLVISNSATITARGATNLTLGADQSATLISTTATNATVH